MQKNFRKLNSLAFNVHDLEFFVLTFINRVFAKNLYKIAIVRGANIFVIL